MSSNFVLRPEDRSRLLKEFNNACEDESSSSEGEEEEKEAKKVVPIVPKESEEIEQESDVNAGDLVRQGE